MCNIGQHPARTVIDRDLLACPSVGAVAANHRLTFHETVKHKARLQARVEHARRQVEQLQLAESLARLHLLVEKTMKVVAAAEESGDLKLMLQAIREAERLTKMIHSLAVDLEPSALFLAATPIPHQSWVRDSVRQAIQSYLKNPCQGSNFENGLPLSPASPPVKPVAALRVKSAGLRHPEKANFCPPDSPAALAMTAQVAPTPSQSSRVGPG